MTALGYVKSSTGGDFYHDNYTSSFLNNLSEFTPTFNATYNATYDSFALNVSLNYTKLTFDEYDTRWNTGGGDNASWNETYADTKYSEIKWGYNMTTPANEYANEINNSQSSWIDSIFLKITNMFTKSEINTMISNNITALNQSVHTGFINKTGTQIDAEGKNWTNAECINFASGGFICSGV